MAGVNWSPGRQLSLLLLTATLSVACADALSPWEMPNAEPLQRPPRYLDLWEEVERCSGKSGDISRIRWLHLPNESSFRYHGRTYSGYWWPTRQILLAGNHTGNDHLVRHEMLHDLLNTGNHPARYFSERCRTEVESQ